MLARGNGVCASSRGFRATRDTYAFSESAGRDPCPALLSLPQRRDVSSRYSSLAPCRRQLWAFQKPSSGLLFVFPRVLASIPGGNPTSLSKPDVHMLSLLAHIVASVSFVLAAPKACLLSKVVISVLPLCRCQNAYAQLTFQSWFRTCGCLGAKRTWLACLKVGHVNTVQLHCTTLLSAPISRAQLSAFEHRVPQTGSLPL